MYKPFRIIAGKTNFDFLGKRAAALILSTAVNIVALALVFVVGLNFGIDFRGGIAIEAKSRAGDADIADMRRIGGDLGVGEVSLQEFGSKDVVLIRIQRQDGGAACVASAGKLLTKRMGAGWSLKPAANAASGDLELTAPATLTSDTARSAAAAIGLQDNLVKAGPSPAKVAMERDQREEWCQQVAILVARDAFDAKYEFRRTESVGPKIGSELLSTGIWAIGLTLLSIAAYVWFRFEWQFGVAALIALVHDVVTTLGMFAVTQLDFGLTALAAVLTIAGYSINDTVVVFDRVRENLRRYKKLTLIELLNVSVNETLSRTLMTSGTVFLAVLALVVFGGPVLYSFSVAMLWGVVVGTYSSIWIACASLVYLKFRPDRVLEKAEAAASDATARP
ncbi:MAG: protein translocase subunit SecF [Rhodospirillales bacterium]|nr:MAG: protein translocase subunit SecF [Rhodospirillales bacterium]